MSKRPPITELSRVTKHRPPITPLGKKSMRRMSLEEHARRRPGNNLETGAEPKG